MILQARALFQPGYNVTPPGGGPLFAFSLVVQLITSPLPRGSRRRARHISEQCYNPEEN